MIPGLDFETYSDAGYFFDSASERYLPLQPGKPGIAGVGATVYAQHKSTEILSLCVDLMDGVGVRLWKAGDPQPEALINYIKAGGLMSAHNSMFEYLIWTHVCHERMGWPATVLSQWRCTQSRAMAWGLPGALGKLSDVLELDDGKKKRGKQLITLLSCPKKPTKVSPGTRRRPAENQELFFEMYDYNHFDVLAEREVSTRVPELPDAELNLWLLDQKINARGVHIDTESLTACVSLFDEGQRLAIAELCEITGGAVNTVGEIAKLKAGDKWAQSRGVTLESFDKAHVEAALECAMPPEVRRVLEIKQEAGGAAGKKIYSMQRSLSRGDRVTGTLRYCGALRTGRWAGRILQTQNMKAGGPEWATCPACGAVFAHTRRAACPACACAYPVENVREWGADGTEAALADIRTGDHDLVVKKWGSISGLIGSCTRGLIDAAPGHDLICSDYSAIEAVVLAALAGEEWRLEVFRTHGKIYEASIAAATGTPLREILDHKIQTGKHHPLRKKGKIRELAAGYSGWIGAWKNFGAGEYMTDDEIKTDVLSWREESPQIVEFWGGQWRKDPDRWDWTPELYGVEGCVIYAISNPGVPVPYRLITFEYCPTDDVLYITLPSGRRLPYHAPRLTRGQNRLGMDAYTITVMGVDAYTQKWAREETYGGKLVENITQATARDILGAALIRLDSHGYRIVMHVHDEVASEVPHGRGSVEHYEQVMQVREPWFADWPIKAAGGWRGRRFRK